jgi:hypothetical protein
LGCRRRINRRGSVAGGDVEHVVATINPIPGDQPDTPAHWSVTFAVADTDAAAQKAAELGGKVIVPPFDAPWTRVTVIGDPQGAMFTASRFTPENKDLGSSAARRTRALDPHSFGAGVTLRGDIRWTAGSCYHSWLLLTTVWVIGRNVRMNCWLSIPFTPGAETMSRKRPLRTTICCSLRTLAKNASSPTSTGRSVPPHSWRSSDQEDLGTMTVQERHAVE